jgi:hypothetical protein
MSDTIYVPFPKSLYNDVIRFSDGKVDPVALAVDQLEAFIERTIDQTDWWGDRWSEVAEIYAPDALEAWQKRNMDRPVRRPVIWKSLTLPPGTELRMTYKGNDHFARVVDGAVVDSDGRFSPAEWCRKIANYTQRNAWRDIWLRMPGEKDFKLAQTLKEEQELLAKRLIADFLGDRK